MESDKWYTREEIKISFETASKRLIIHLGNPKQMRAYFQQNSDTERNKSEIIYIGLKR